MLKFALLAMLHKEVIIPDFECMYARFEVGWHCIYQH